MKNNGKFGKKCKCWENEKETGLKSLCNINYFSPLIARFKIIIFLSEIDQ